MSDDSNDVQSGPFEISLRLFCGINIAIYIWLILLGGWNVIRILRRSSKNNGTQTLIILYYVFMVLSLLTNCLNDVWVIIYPDFNGT